MTNLRRCLLFVVTAVPLSVAATMLGAEERQSVPEVIEFNRDVRPILSDACFFCHGPDARKREADLLLDQREGLAAVVTPGNPDESELYRRIVASDADLKMPPASSGKSLTDREVAILRKWIEQGAAYEGHWAFAPLKRPQIPPIPTKFSALVDAQSARPIDTFVLSALQEHSLAPGPVADRSTLIRRLSLDLTGLPPRRAEVDAFVNDGSPDAYEIVVDRLLGSPHFGERMAVFWLDLVRYADSVGYHADQEVTVAPFRTYVVESFNVNKRFDQFTIEQLAGDLFPHPSQQDLIASGYNRLGMMSGEGGVQDKEYLAKYIAERVRNVSGTWLGVTLGCCECHDHKYDPFTSRDFYRLEAFFADITEQGLYAGGEGGNWGPTMRVADVTQAAALAELDQQIRDLNHALDTPTDELAAAQAEWERSLSDAATLPPEIAEIFRLPAAERQKDQADRLAGHYRSICPELEPTRQQLAKLKASHGELDSRIPRMLLTVPIEPRAVRVLPRGNWMDDSGELVTPGYPACLSAAEPATGRLTRLDLAHWIVSGENPLTARVFVNRVWKLLFGAGLSRRVDDFGAQGESPSHPLLLDYLAGDFIDSGWDVKRLIRTIVVSRTYRQSSLGARESWALDPSNRWLSRQGRFRLDAEFVRDNALAISGLLVEKIGGPSVKPYQPAGYWAHLNYPPREWQAAPGEDLYRRGLYTHWQRQYLHPSLRAFDAPPREECTADRPRSNTPLQALALLNDPTYIEAARAFAESVLRHGGTTTVDRLDWAFRTAVARRIRPGEAETLIELLEQQRTHYRDNREATEQLLHVGVKPVADGVDSVELAAWTNVARAILNMNETITRY